MTNIYIYIFYFLIYIFNIHVYILSFVYYFQFFNMYSIFIIYRYAVLITYEKYFSNKIHFLLFLGIVTTWRTARSGTPPGVVGVAAAVAADPSPPLSNTYAPPRENFTMVSRTSTMRVIVSRHIFNEVFFFFRLSRADLVCLEEGQKCFSCARQDATKLVSLIESAKLVPREYAGIACQCVRELTN